MPCVVNAEIYVVLVVIIHKTPDPDQWTLASKAPSVQIWCKLYIWWESIRIKFSLQDFKTELSINGSEIILKSWPSHWWPISSHTILEHFPVSLIWTNPLNRVGSFQDPGQRPNYSQQRKCNKPIRSSVSKSQRLSSISPLQTKSLLQNFPWLWSDWLIKGDIHNATRIKDWEKC